MDSTLQELSGLAEQMVALRKEQAAATADAESEEVAHVPEARQQAQDRLRNIEARMSDVQKQRDTLVEAMKALMNKGTQDRLYEQMLAANRSSQRLTRVQLLLTIAAIAAAWYAALRPSAPIVVQVPSQATPLASTQRSQ